MIQPLLQGAEIELAVIDHHGQPVFEIEGQQPVHFLQHAFKNDSRMKDFKKLGSFEEEVFRHQIELVTKVQKTSNLIAATLEMFDITIDMLNDIGLKVSEHQPIKIEKTDLKTMITPRDYYIDSTAKVHEMTDARNASTTGIHLHSSFVDNLTTLKTHFAICEGLSKNIVDQPDSRFLQHHMSQSRFDARNQITHARTILGEITGVIDEPIVQELDTRQTFLQRQHFGEKSLEQMLSMKHKLQTDNWGQALKKKGKFFTTEARLADGPGMDREKIKLSINHINQMIATGLDHHADLFI